jgi:hypothetical protein
MNNDNVLHALQLRAGIQSIDRPLEGEFRAAALETALLIHAGLITFEHGVALLKASQRTNQSVSKLVGIETPGPISIACDMIRVGLALDVEVYALIATHHEFPSLWIHGLKHPGLSLQLRFIAVRGVDQMAKQGTVDIQQARAICEQLLSDTAAFTLDASKINSVGNRLSPTQPNALSVN